MPPADTAKPAGIAAFGPYRLCAAERRLERDGATVDIGSRALELLIVLVEHAGEPVRNRDLLARVWRDMVVEESSLRVNIAGLRKALGDGVDGARYVINIPTQGYCFAAPVTHVQARPAAGQAGAPTLPAYALPNRLKRMIGRTEQVGELTARLQAQRFVSIVGPGGMGKTTVALAIAHALLPHFDGEVCFFDLATLATPDVLGSTVAATLGLKLPPGDPMPGLLSWLREKDILLVLDNCEHLVDTVAPFAERLIDAGPGVHVLATSRESLRAEGEYAYRLPPLPHPPPGTHLSAAHAMTFPAVQLFVDRAMANGNDFALSDADATIIGDICRQLDGIALAIELGASRVATFGVRGTAQLLDNRFRLTWHGRRTALPRHQTLSAMLDWSYNLLPECERQVLRRLSTFVGLFSIDAARRIAFDTDEEGVQVLQMIESLVAKSLAAVESDGLATRYRLLESARVYAADKLRSSSEEDDIARRHAAYLAGYIGGKQATLSTFIAFDDGAARVDMLGNVRACLAWCFAPDGDAALGIALCAAAAPLLLELSLLAECQQWTGTALARLHAAGGRPHEEMALQEAFAIAAMFTSGNSDAVLGAIGRALALACQLGDRIYELRLLAGMHIFMTRVGDLDAALDIAARSIAVAQSLGLPAALAMAEWMLGVAYHLIGDQAGAVRHCEAGLAHAAGMPPMNTLCFGYDHRIRAEVALARALWLSGQADRAVAAAWGVIRAGEQLGHPISHCMGLIWSIPIFIWRGEWPIAEELIERLRQHADSHLLAPYCAIAQGLKGELLIKRGAPAEGIALLQDCMHVVRANQHQVLSTVHVGARAEGLLALGRVTDALAAIETAVAMGEQVFSAPEVLRIHGEILAALPAADLDAAQDCLQRALDCARRQHACGWALRAATSLGRLLARRGRARAAHALLREVLGGQHEGTDTADHLEAQRVLDALAGT